MKCKLCKQPITKLYLIRKQVIVDNSEYGYPDVWKEENFHEQCYVEDMIKQLNKKGTVTC